MCAYALRYDAPPKPGPDFRLEVALRDRFADIHRLERLSEEGEGFIDIFVTWSVLRCVRLSTLSACWRHNL